MNNIHLYIGETELEFDAVPEILYTYQVDDLTNPTVVKNSFSKTITVKGTKTNNHLFGHYWNVERSQVGGSDNASSIYFNASKKMKFSLFVDTELYEEGYVKLDEVRRVNGDYEYDISLFGGLGDFFYSLTTSESGDKKKLSDLDYREDIDFTINLDTVKEAWNCLQMGKLGKWQIINFMPAYNGLPEDFDSSKMLMDINNTTLVKAKSSDGKVYKTKNDWVMAELPSEMTEWETRDLRSYLQRPCIRMKEIVKACCRPQCNGGYEVELDPDFFNANNDYWEKTWLSLPMLQSLEYNNGEQQLPNSTLMVDTAEGSVEGYFYQPFSFDMGEYPSSIVSRINLRATINPDINNYGTYYPNTSWAWFWNKNGDSYHSGQWCFGSLFCQLLAFNGDTVVGASTVKNLTTPVRHNGKLYFGTNSAYKGGHQFKPYMSQPIYDYLGTFTKDGFVGEGETTPYVFNFTIDGLTTNVTSVKMCYYWGATEDKMKKTGRAASLYDTTKDTGWFEFNRRSISMTDVTKMKLDLKSSTLKAVLGGTIGRTGTDITKNMLLNTEASPCDYLLSYCKMFGLYFSKDIYENKIYIQTRKTFYNRDKINDLTGLVDYTKGVTIKPIVFDTKWVEFSQEQDETQYVVDYNNSKGIIYGSKVLNTGYEFNSDKKKLLEGNVIKSGIEGLERSKYFTCYNNDNRVRPWFGYGLKYYLYNGSDTIEMIGSNSSGSNILGINEAEGLKFYDVFPKMQFHDGDNSPSEGNNCLVFFSGFKNLTTDRANPINYFISDDSYYQTQLNEGSPCWLFVSGDKDVNGKKVARKLSHLPVFERYLTNNNGTTVKRSLDFGSPQELYISNYSLNDEVNIYSNFWKSYLEDIYDINTRVLTIYVKLSGKIGYDLLREFYWFENAIWRINKIVDWGIGSDEPTKIEFVKVQDIDNYTSITQAQTNNISINSPKYSISKDGEHLTLTVTTTNGGNWRIVGSSNALAFSKINGVGNGTLTLTIPQTNNPTAPTRYSVTVVDDEGNTSTIYLVQGYENETQLDITPKNMIIGAEGGAYNVDFKWINQGDNDITEYNFDGDVTGNVEFEGLSAVVNVNENTEDTVISGLLHFTGGEFKGEVGIDQLPAVLEFDKDGGDYEFSFNYNTPIIANLPSWITIKGKTITVLPNYYDTEREATIAVSNGDTVASVAIKQEVGGISPSAPKVTPTSLYFHKKGEVQLLTINITNQWIIRNPLDWVSVNMTNSDSNATVMVSTTQNDGAERKGYIEVKDMLTHMTYAVAISQMGDSTTPTFTISPTSIDVPSDGGTYDVSVNYQGKNGDYVDIIFSDGLDSNIGLWQGDDLSLQVIVPANTSTNTKNHTVTFETSIGTYTLPITQEGVLANAVVKPNRVLFDSEGGSSILKFRSNTEWYAEPSVSWLNITPNGGQSTLMTISLTVNATTNNSLQERTGYIYIKADETDAVLDTITVIQGGFEEYINVSPSTISFDPENGGEHIITISSNTDWTVEIIE